jgi:hypothetical protein
MSETRLLPIIAELAEARSDAERAAWLIRCPYGILRRYDFTIRNRLDNAGFDFGAEYLDAVRVADCQVRDGEGEFPASSPIHRANAVLRLIISRAVSPGEPAGAPPAVLRASGDAVGRETVRGARSDAVGAARDDRRPAAGNAPADGVTSLQDGGDE